MAAPNPAPPTQTTLIRGGIAAMIGGAAMAMFAMAASVTYQHHGFFTPLSHISVAVGNPNAMMTGAAYGMMFAVFAVFARATRNRMLLSSGALFGLIVFVASSFIGLPIAAAVTNSGSVLSDMAKMVGWTTFAVEHLIFGLTVGAVLLVASRGTDRQVPAPVAARTTATV
ncbi:MAG: hypothetical protein ACR2MB_15270 [Acidimicrobiales bacterium]